MKKTRIIIILSVLITLLLGCNLTVGHQMADKKLRENICGNWEIIYEKADLEMDFSLLSSFSYPQGMTISSDSIEFYLGLFKESRDSSYSPKPRQYLGNFAQYKTTNDSIFIRNPSTNLWEFKWKFLNLLNDTLILAINKNKIARYKKLSYNFDTIPDYDQIIYSSSGCYGYCPIIDISITKKGDVLFRGEGYVKQLGFHSGILDSLTKNYIFNKFSRANPSRLMDNYAVDHTDDQCLTTTFIQNGKIVKTIHDYGMAGPNELIWAYIPISNIYSILKLQTLDEPFYPKLHFLTFKKAGLKLALEKSESFYLSTELKKSKLTNENFISKYKLTFSKNYSYWGPDPDKERAHKHEIKSVTTDGQYFKFEFKDAQEITYDLGYNFVDRNFQTTDFKKANDWEE